MALSNAIRQYMSRIFGVSSSEQDASKELCDTIDSLIAEGNMETFSIAGYTVNKDNLLVLFGNAQSSTRQDMTEDGTTAYQVPEGKKLFIMAGRTPGNTGWSFGYCDNDPGLDPVDPDTLVNLVRIGGDFGFFQQTSQVGNAQEFSAGVEIPAGKYPVEQSGDGGPTTITYYCVLLDA